MNLKFVIKQYGKMAAQNVFLPAVYGICRFRPIRKNSVVFADAHHMSRPENMRALVERLSKEPDLQIAELYLDYQKASFGSVLKHMVRFMKLYAQAGTVVLCDNFLPAAGCRKRNGTKVVQLWHACGALKRFGYDTTDDIPKQYKGNVFQNTDLVTVSAPFCEPHFASAMRLKRENVKALGICRTDHYFDPLWRAQAGNSLREKYPETVGRKIIVWAPTFRGNPGMPECIDLNTEKLEERLNRILREKGMTPCRILVKLHPHMEKEGEKRSCRVPTEQLFASADVLIGDYSSLIYEYMLFDGEMVLFTPDYDEYTGKRGFYMSFDEIPGLRAGTEEELEKALLQALEVREKPGRVNELREERKQFVQTYMSACDGHSTERVAAWILKQARSESGS